MRFLQVQQIIDASVKLEHIEITVDNALYAKQDITAQLAKVKQKYLVQKTQIVIPLKCRLFNVRLAITNLEIAVMKIYVIAEMAQQPQEHHAQVIIAGNALAAILDIINLEIAAIKINVTAEMAQQLEENPVLEMELRNALAAIVAITNLETAA